MTIIYTNETISVSKLFCDKLSFTIDYPSEYERQHIQATAKELLKSKLAKQKIRSPYKQGLVIYQGEFPSQLQMLVQWEPKFQGVSYLRVDFNPAYADVDGVLSLLSHILPGGLGDYLSRAIFTRFDATIDVYGLLPRDLVAYYPPRSVTKTNCKSGEIETLVVGTADASNQLVLYNKTLQLKEKKKKYSMSLPHPNSPTTRVEIRMKPEVGAEELIGVENPFAKLLLRPVSMIPADGPETWRLFVALVQRGATQDALLLLDESTRKSFKAKLKAVPNDWWHPEEIWESWPTLVAEVLALKAAPSTTGAAAAWVPAANSGLLISYAAC